MTPSSTTRTPTKASTKPLRADAQRNRERLIAAGREVFAERGFEASLDDIADHAGVGVGTAYRRFPNKEALIDEIFEERMAEIRTMLDEAGEMEDPWQALQFFVLHLLEFQSQDRGLKQAFHERDEGRERVTKAKEEMQPALVRIVERAQAAGKLRADATVTDILIGVMMIGAVIDATRDVRPDAWRRYLGFAFDGLAADRGGTHELAAPPITPEEFDEALRCGDL